MEEVEDSSPMDPSTPKQAPNEEAEDSSPKYPVRKQKILPYTKSPQQGSRRFSLKIPSEPCRK